MVVYGWGTSGPPARREIPGTSGAACAIVGVVLVVVGALLEHKGIVMLLFGGIFIAVAVVSLVRVACVQAREKNTEQYAAAAQGMSVGDRALFIGGCRPAKTLSHLFSEGRLRVGDEGFVEQVSPGRSYPLLCRFPEARICVAAGDLHKVQSSPVADGPLERCETLLRDSEGSLRGWTSCCAVLESLQCDSDDGDSAPHYNVSVHRCDVTEQREVRVPARLLRRTEPVSWSSGGRRTAAVSWQMHRAVLLMVYGVSAGGVRAKELLMLLSSFVASFHRRPVFPRRSSGLSDLQLPYRRSTAVAALDNHPQTRGYSWRWDPWARLLPSAATASSAEEDGLGSRRSSTASLLRVMARTA